MKFSLPQRLTSLSAAFLALMQAFPLQAMEPVPPFKTPVWMNSPPAHAESRHALIRSCAEAARPKSQGQRGHTAYPSAPTGGGFATLKPSSIPTLDVKEAREKSSPSAPLILGSFNRSAAPKKVEAKIRRADKVYLSNDDSMSLASAQRLIYAIQNFMPIYREEIRPHELLNYFHFKTEPLAAGSTFSVKAQAAPRENGETLALAVQGKMVDLAGRRPAVLTFIVDKSGSMEAAGKMEYLKEGLALLKSQLKNGDVLNVVEFDDRTCNAIEGFEVGRDPWRSYDTTVAELEPEGSTNLHQGLVEGYKLAERFHDPTKINRVILITDAIANTGELSPELMASIGKYYDERQIALSGIGVGLDFNDELLDTLTEKGKGAYLFLGMREVLPRVFGVDFISLLDTVARDVHFQAFFPKEMHLEVFYGEEVSTEKAQVQAIHYFANSSQLFLLDLTGKASGEDPFRLQIEYSDPVSGQAKTEAFSASMSSIRQSGQENVAKARLLMALAQLLESTALPGARPNGDWRPRSSSASLKSPEGVKACAKAQEEMQKQVSLYSDAETNLALELGKKYCSRF